MTIQILFAAQDPRWPQYEGPLRHALERTGITDFNLARDIAPEEVDYMVVAPNGPVQDFTPYKNCKVAMNLWAGVENIIGNPTLHMPLARMVDHGLTRGMVEWVTGHVLRHHLGMDAHIHGQDGKWRTHIPPLAEQRRVTILGLGELGAECGDALNYLKFDVTGWSRSPKDLPGIRCLHGEDGLREALSTAEILVLLLPKTPQTENLLDAQRLAMLPQGAIIINPGRGPLIDDQALLEALDTGHIAHATLDVFRTEPLPENDPYWSHPSVTVTPHIASETRDETASQVIAENIRRGEAGEPFLHLVDPKLGY
ncbi:MAG: glyoxylate/hydroxypyruvate reductase A [Roseovarius sp.]